MGVGAQSATSRSNPAQVYSCSAGGHLWVQRDNFRFEVVGARGVAERWYGLP